MHALPGIGMAPRLGRQGRFDHRPHDVPVQFSSDQLSRDNAIALSSTVGNARRCNTVDEACVADPYGHQHAPNGVELHEFAYTDIEKIKCPC
jgi:hypothetical protein